MKTNSFVVRAMSCVTVTADSAGKKIKPSTLVLMWNSLLIGQGEEVENHSF